MKFLNPGFSPCRQEVPATIIFATGPGEADAQAALGDAWWEASNALPTSEQSAARLRAVHWYRQALPELRGLVKVRIERLLQDF